MALEDVTTARTDLYFGLFRWHSAGDGQARVSRHPLGPRTVPCPKTGRLLRVATLDTGAAAICPSCESQGHGGYVSFEGDLRMAYACPQCLQLVWVAGA